MTRVLVGSLDFGAICFDTACGCVYRVEGHGADWRIGPSIFLATIRACQRPVCQPYLRKPLAVYYQTEVDVDDFLALLETSFGENET